MTAPIRLRYSVTGIHRGVPPWTRSTRPNNIDEDLQRTEDMGGCRAPTAYSSLLRRVVILTGGTVMM
jgi:hypothetical protein